MLFDMTVEPAPPARFATVVKVNGRQRDKFLADPNFLYVGRAFAGWPASPFGNPFKPGMDIHAALRIFETVPFDDLTDFEGMDFSQSLETMNAVQRFEFYFLSRKSLMNRIPDLCGLTLGCWCLADEGDGNGNNNKPEICHAQILARLANRWKEGL